MDSLIANLLTPLSGSASHSIEPWAMWHARLMVLAWGLLLPLGALVARFFKLWPGQEWPRVLDHKGWWHAHRFLQYSGVVLMLVGLLLLWGRSGNAPTQQAGAELWVQLHAALGWVVCALGLLQVLGAWARGSKGGPTEPTLRGDHYDMTPWRVAFERLHKFFGWLAVLAAVVVLASGLVISDAPRWMVLVLVLWWLALAVMFWRWQKAGHCVDTYQAIWGPDPQLPGNRRQPTGPGVHRPAVRVRARS